MLRTSKKTVTTVIYYRHVNQNNEDHALILSSNSDPNVESSSGNDFAIGFFGNNDGANPSQAVAVLYIGTNDPKGAEVTVEVPNRPSITMFPMHIYVEPPWNNERGSLSRWP